LKKIVTSVEIILQPFKNTEVVLLAWLFTRWLSMLEPGDRAGHMSRLALAALADCPCQPAEVTSSNN
jgi:hypothetical protein